MFSGIVEAQSSVLAASHERNLVRIRVARPPEFTDIRLGDSIANDGVCLTVEAFTADDMTFALGAETLKITGWSAESLHGRALNLERSLRFGDRVHGHIVTGHVDATAKIAEVADLGGSVSVRIEVPGPLRPYVWKKGSWAVNGVSLTVNSVDNGVAEVCLIPETLKRTNLGALKKGDTVNLEVDWLARGLVHAMREGEGPGPRA